MKRNLGFIILIFITLYTSLIYNSQSFFMLFCGEIAFGSLMLVLGVKNLKSMEVLYDIPVRSITLQGSIPINITYKGKMPMGAVNICMMCTNIYTGKKKKIMLRGNLSEININYKPKTTGYYEIRIKKAYVYDYIGILSFPVKNFNRDTQKIVVVPEFYDVNVFNDKEISGTSFAMTGNQSRHNTLSDEMTSIRSYRAGDRLRNIHWKLTSKMDDIMVRENDAIYNDVFVLFAILEHRKNIAEFEKLIQTLASFSNSMIKNGDKHFISWHDFETGDIVRYMISSHEDIFEIIAMLSENYLKSHKNFFEHNIDNMLIQYNQKYNTDVTGNYMMVDMELNVYLKDETVIKLSSSSLEKSLSEIEIVI